MDKKKVIQIGILVKDIQQTAKDWAEFLGVDVPKISRTAGVEVTHAVYKGEPCNGRIDQVCFDFDNIQIELISPVDEEPSFWKECLDRDGEGLHHIAFHTQEIEKDMEALEQKGYVVLQKGYWPDQPRDGAYAYADTVEKLKCTIELLDFIK